jgi:acyl dehydratase
MSTFENLEPGGHYPGGSVTLTDEHRALVATLGGYTHPLFTDPVYVREQSPFSSALVPGELTLFLLGGLAEQSGLFGDDVVALVGIDEVRFPSAALVGDTITLEMEVGSHEREAGRSTGTITLNWRASKQTSEEVLTCLVTMLVREPRT